jgi:predicted nucleic acid-binding protein
MRPILLDTNAYSAFKRSDKTIAEVIQHAEIIAISPIVLGELLSGFDTGTKAKKNREDLQQFLNSSRIRVYPLTSDTANFYSEIYCSLKNKGKPIPTNDIWIAAQALENGCLICTYDKHFNSIDGILSGSTLAELII